MVTLLIVLLIAALGLLCVEIFIPGFGVCGILGLACFVISAALTVLFIPFGLLLVVLEVGVMGAACFFGYRFITCKQLRGKLILDETLNEDTADLGDLNHMIGKEGVAVTPLKPFGFVDFNGIQVEATSSGPFIAAQAKVKVANTANRKIIVKQIV